MLKTKQIYFYSTRGSRRKPFINNLKNSKQLSQLFFGFIISALFSLNVIAQSSIESPKGIKYCKVSGIYYCNGSAAYPSESERCSTDPLAAIQPGVNYPQSWDEWQPPDETWTFTPWYLSYCSAISSSTSRTAQSCVYRSHWSSPNWTGGFTESASMGMVICKKCPEGYRVGEGYNKYTLCVRDESQIPPSNHGNSCEISTGNPINIATGNKFFAVTDYSDKDFTVSRYYNSKTGKWSFNYLQAISLTGALGQSLQTDINGNSFYPHTITARRADSKQLVFTYDGTSDVVNYQSPSQRKEILRLSNPAFITTMVENQRDIYLRGDDGLIIIENNEAVVADIDNTHELTVGNAVETYNVRGQLTKIQVLNKDDTNLVYVNNTIAVQKNSQTLLFTLDENNRVSEIQLSDNSRIQYHYIDDQNALERVVRIYPDDSEVVLNRYLYEDTRFPTYITGIEDANSNRISTVIYDDQGRAISSEKGPLNSGIERSQIDYHADGSRTVTNALGKQTTYHFTQFNGEYKMTSVEGHPSENCAGANKAYTYDANGFLESKTDWKGNTTTYIHNDRGQETSRTEAAGTPEARTITTEWHPDFNLPTRIIESERDIVMSYDDKGRLQSRQVLPR